METPLDPQKVPLSSVKSFATELVSPWIVAWEPIKELLDPTNDQDDLTRKWYEAKLAELSFTGLTVSVPPPFNTP